MNILRTKRDFKMKQKTFFIILKGLSLKQKSKLFWKVRVRPQTMHLITSGRIDLRSFMRFRKNYKFFPRWNTIILASQTFKSSNLSQVNFLFCKGSISVMTGSTFLIIDSRRFQVVLHFLRKIPKSHSLKY